MEQARKTGPALEALFQFILWLAPTVEKFPRSQKFLLGDRIHSTALDVLENLVEATYRPTRRGSSSLPCRYPGHVKPLSATDVML